jgi:hypothetical protein
VLQGIRGELEELKWLDRAADSVNTAPVCLNIPNRLPIEP